MSSGKPDGYNNVMPYLSVEDVGREIEFLKQAFGAEEMMRVENDRGAHAEVRIGDSVVMMGSTKGSPNVSSALIYVYVDDTDAVFEHALAAGGVTFERPNDTPYGDRRAPASRDPVRRTSVWIATGVK